MGILSNLEPKAVFSYFEDFCAIPHRSGNTQKISDYCVDFAKKHNLEHRRDALGNVIIKKAGTVGKENSPTVMLQGHLDMVCEQDKSKSQINMDSDGLELIVEGDILRANATTLGADNGIAGALALGILAADNLAHPPLEVVLTVDEEVGLIGATALDTGDLKSTKMINLDAEEEGTFFTSCAGGVTAECTLPIERKDAIGTILTITVSGLKGGHSGIEIDKGRGNAAKILTRFLYSLSSEIPFLLVSIEGGLKDNAIPLFATATILVKDKNEKKVGNFTHLFDKTVKNELKTSDPNVKISLSDQKTGTALAMTAGSTKKAVCFLNSLPNGVQSMSADVEGLVESSLNLGILKSHNSEITASFGVRSSVDSLKWEIVSRLSSLCDLAYATLKTFSPYPGWEYNPSSPLRDVFRGAYLDLFGKEAQTTAIHAGLECGLFSGKMPGIDCIAFGPDMKGVHTPQEQVSISSVYRTWDLLCEVLKRL